MSDDTNQRYVAVPLALLEDLTEWAETYAVVGSTGYDAKGRRWRDVARQHARQARAIIEADETCKLVIANPDVPLGHLSRDEALANLRIMLGCAIDGDIPEGWKQASPIRLLLERVRLDQTIESLVSIGQRCNWVIDREDEARDQEGEAATPREAMRAADTALAELLMAEQGAEDDEDEPDEEATQAEPPNPLVEPQPDPTPSKHPPATRHFESINAISRDHHNWLREMGWVGTTTLLEQLALVVSEVGEAVNECRGSEPTPALADELADIVLRVLGVFDRLGIEPAEALRSKMAKNRERGNRGRVK